MIAEFNIRPGAMNRSDEDCSERKSSCISCNYDSQENQAVQFSQVLRLTMWTVLLTCGNPSRGKGLRNASMKYVRGHAADGAEPPVISEGEEAEVEEEGDEDVEEEEGEEMQEEVAGENADKQPSMRLESKR